MRRAQREIVNSINGENLKILIIIYILIKLAVEE